MGGGRVVKAESRWGEKAQNHETKRKQGTKNQNETLTHLTLRRCTLRLLNPPLTPWRPVLLLIFPAVLSNIVHTRRAQRRSGDVLGSLQVLLAIVLEERAAVSAGVERKARRANAEQSMNELIKRGAGENTRGERDAEAGSRERI
jgi:hypothetical protein